MPAAAGGDTWAWLIPVCSIIGALAVILGWPRKAVIWSAVRRWGKAGGQAAALHEADDALVGAQGTIGLWRERVAALEESDKLKDASIADLRAQNVTCQEETQKLRGDLDAIAQQMERMTSRRDAIFTFFEAWAMLHQEMHMPDDVRAEMPKLPDHLRHPDGAEAQ